MVSLSKIKQVIELLKEHDLGEIHIQYDAKSSVTIKDKQPNQTFIPPGLNTQLTQATEAQALPSEVGNNLSAQHAPMVGTAYLTPSPEADSFVNVGDRVKKGDTLCLIEAMKMFNKICADFSGTIEKICVENGATVEFDQPLFLIKED